MSKSETHQKLFMSGIWNMTSPFWIFMWSIPVRAEFGASPNHRISRTYYRAAILIEATQSQNKLQWWTSSAAFCNVIMEMTYLPLLNSLTRGYSRPFPRQQVVANFRTRQTIVHRTPEQSRAIRPDQIFSEHFWHHIRHHQSQKFSSGKSDRKTASNDYFKSEAALQLWLPTNIDLITSQIFNLPLQITAILIALPAAETNCLVHSRCTTGRLTLSTRCSAVDHCLQRYYTAVLTAHCTT